MNPVHRLSRPTKILLCGYYGFGNAGDELILGAMLLQLRRRLPAAEFSVASGDPPATAAEHGVSAFHWQDIPALLTAVRASDLVVIGGGGLFQDHWGCDPDALLTPDHTNIAYYAGPAVAAALHGRRVALVGVGVGPLTTTAGRELLRAAAEAADLISVRDPESRKLVASLGIPESSILLGADPAFALADEVEARRRRAQGGPGERRRLRLGVALRPWSIGVSARYWEGEVVAALRRVVAAGSWELVFLPFQISKRTNEDDLALAERVAGQLPDSVARTLVEAGSPGQLAAALGECDLVLSMRLHGAILAALHGVVPVALAYDPKVHVLMERLGLQDVSIGLGDLDADRLVAALELAAANRTRLLNRLAPGVRSALETVHRDMDRLAELVESGPKPKDRPGAGLSQVASRLLATLVDRRLSLSQEVLGLEDRLRRTEEAAGGLQREFDAQSQQLLETRTESARLRGENERLQNELAAAQAEVGRLAGETAEVRQTLSQAQETHRSHSLQLEQALAWTREELGRIKASRAYRIMEVYWQFSHRLGRRPRRPIPGGGAGRTQGDSDQDAPGPATSPRAGRAADALAEAEGWTGRFELLCLPIIDWGFRFQRPQQLMSRLASGGHRVWYVAQGFLAGDEVKTSRVAENLEEVMLPGPPLNVYRDNLDEEGLQRLFAGVDLLRRERNLTTAVVVVQLPFWWPLAERLRERFGWPVVYDCMDDHGGFSTNRPEMVAMEEELVARADLVVASSKPLQDRLLRRREKVELIRNACDWQHFSAVPPPPGQQPPVVGYYGAIADWFDSDLVAELAVRRPDWRFVLVGSTYTGDVSRLERLPNVTLLGERPYVELPGLLAGWDVLILPFKRSSLTEATNPVKAYEILAAGRPLVSVPLPEMAELEEVVGLAETVEEFEHRISEALGEDGSELIDRRREVARENTWEHRVSSLANSLDSLFPLVSVVVVTWNNRVLSRRCLESVLTRTDWPRYEVIVVDNGSTDGTGRAMAELAASDPRVRVLENAENLGFAAATNQGMAVSRGDFLVLLNNDTVVTRGWLTALVGHLREDPGLGLVGPVSNAIGNAAQVSFGYRDLSGLDAWAARYTQDHRGLRVPLPALAFFCVALRRSLLDEVGPLDDRFAVGMFEDDDFCRRVRAAGFRLACAHDSFVHHQQKASFRLLGDDAYRQVFEANRARYEEKWGESWQAGLGKNWNTESYLPVQRQLEGVLRQAGASRGLVVILPSVGWNIHLHQRPHHLARACARMGFVCVFDCSNAHDDVEGFKELEPNLFLYRGPSDLLHAAGEPILWSFTYNVHEALEYPEGARLVYDWIDDLGVFPQDRRLLEANHRLGLERAAVVAAVSRDLVDQAESLRPDAVYLPNAVDADHFVHPAPSTRLCAEMSRILARRRPVAGYYGALAEWFDYDLLEAVARLRPDWEFVLIGPRYDASLDGRGLLRLANVTWLGPRSYGELPAYLRAFDVALIPFVLNDITHATSPLKLYEYFAGGKPVVVTPMRECRQFPEVLVGGEPEEFAALLDQALERGRDSTFRERVRALGRANSWQARIEAVLEALPESAHHPGGSRAGLSN